MLENFLAKSILHQGPRPKKLQNWAILLVKGKIGPKEFTLGFGSKVWRQKQSVVIGASFLYKTSVVPTEAKLSSYFEESNLQAWVQFWVWK